MSFKREFLSMIWLVCAIGIIAVLSYFGSFGGVKMISTGWDIGLTIIAAFVIYLLSFVSRLPPKLTVGYLARGWLFRCL